MYGAEALASTAFWPFLVLLLCYCNKINCYAARNSSMLSQQNVRGATVFAACRSDPIIKNRCNSTDEQRERCFFFFFSSHLLSSPFLFSVPPTRNCDPKSDSKLSSPLPSTYGWCLAFFIPRRLQLFLPSSTRFELCVLTVGALSTLSLFYLCKYIKDLTTAGFELTDQHY